MCIECRQNAVYITDYRCLSLTAYLEVSLDCKLTVGLIKYICMVFKYGDSDPSLLETFNIELKRVPC